MGLESRLKHLNPFKLSPSLGVFDRNDIEEPFSVDVITCDKEGCLDIGYWNFDIQMWIFHTEQLCDPYEGGKLVDFVWMYRPNELKVK